MTKCTDCVTFCATSIAFTKYYYIYTCLLLFCLQFFIPQISLKIGFTMQTIFNAHSTPLLSILLTVQIQFSYSFNTIL